MTADGDPTGIDAQSIGIAVQPQQCCVRIVEPGGIGCLRRQAIVDSNHHTIIFPRDSLQQPGVAISIVRLASGMVTTVATKPVQIVRSTGG